MSISKPSLEHPCKKWIDFKGNTGLFVYYDKETEKQIEIKLPIFFIVLDELATITGFNKKHDCGIYSNEVHRTADELLRVKTFSGGEEIIGLYSDIKDSIIALGGKYTKSVYALLIKPDKSTEMVNFKFKGASFSGWLEKKFNVDRSAVGVMSFTEAVNGTITYKVPVFQKFKMTEDLKERAIAADIVLQDYLEKYFENAPQKSTETYVPASVAAKVDLPDPAARPFPATPANKDSYSFMQGDPKIMPNDMPNQDFYPSGDDELSDLPF